MSTLLPILPSDDLLNKVSSAEKLSPAAQQAEEEAEAAEHAD